MKADQLLQADTEDTLEDVCIHTYVTRTIHLRSAAAAAAKVLEAQRVAAAVIRTATHSNTVLVSRATRALKHAVESAEAAVHKAVEEEIFHAHNGVFTCTRMLLPLLLLMPCCSRWKQ